MESEEGKTITTLENSFATYYKISEKKVVISEGILYNESTYIV